MTTPTRADALRALLALQEDRNQMYVLLRHHEDNLDRGLRLESTSSSLLRMPEEVERERADYAAFAERVEVAKREFRVAYPDDASHDVTI
jgi:outer membrane protein TolC